MPVWSTFGAMSRLGFSSPNPPLPIVPGATVYLDAATPTSYSGTGSTINDLTASGNNGTIIGGVTFSNTAGGAWFLDGRSGFIRVGPVANSGTSNVSWTMGMWVAPQTQVGNLIGMSSTEPSDGWQMPPMGVRQQRFVGQVWQGNVLSQGAAYTIGTWYYVVLVWDNANAQQRLYVNGSLIETQTSATYSASGASNYLNIGKNIEQAVQNYGWLRGWIGNFHFYGGTALTNDQVLFNYNALSARYTSAPGSPINTTNLGLYVDTNRIGSANNTTTWTDMSGNGLNFTTPGSSTQLTVRPIGGNPGNVLDGGLISPGGLISNGGSGGNYWNTAATSLLNTDTHTISMWIKFNSTTAWPNSWNNTWEKFFGHPGPTSDRSPGLWRWPSNRYVHWRYDPGNTSADHGPITNDATFAENPNNPNFVMDTWYHTCVTKNGAVAKNYINGSPIGVDRTVANPKAAYSSNIYFYEAYGGASMQIDGLQVYNRVLSNAEVLQNYTALRGRYEQYPSNYRLVFSVDASNPASYSGTGTVVNEISGRQITGTMSNVTYNGNAVDYTGTNVGGFWSFNGTNSGIAFQNDTIHDISTGAVTAEVWVKPANFSQNGFFIEKGVVNSQYSLFIAGNALYWRTQVTGGGHDSVITPTNFMNTTEWHHVVGTYSSGNKNIYINGVKVSSTAAATGIFGVNAEGMSLGRHGTPNSYWYNGQIGEARVYNRQLTDAQVLYNYNITKGRYAKASLPAPATITVTGGTLASDATYYYRTFTTNDNLVTSGTLTADVFVVAGGGAGGSSAGGGGGAGGLIIHPNASIPAGTYAVAIGAGGTNTVVNGNGNPGANTTIGAIYTAFGGGRGTAWGGGNGAIHDGGSSGGSGAQSGTTGGSTPTRGTSTLTGWTALGNAGGNGNGSSAGGGGGSDGAGVTGNWGAGRAATYGGGPGLTYAQGGQPGSTGGASVPAARTANSGSGGGSGGDNRQGANGASGIVIIRYTRSQITGG